MRSVSLSIPYRPFEPYQANFHRSRARFKVLVAGARGGKTICAGHECADKGLDQPNYPPDQRERGEPYTILVGAKHYPWVERVILPTILKAIPKELHVGPYHGTKHTFTVRGRHGPTRFQFIHGDPNSWVSFNANGFWIDEFCQVKEELYNEAMTRVGNTRGWGVLSGTPMGPNWAFKRIYEPWLHGNPHKLYFSSWPTAANPYFPQDELTRLKRDLPPRYYNRTYNATWDTFEGQVFDEFVHAVHVFDPADYSFVLPSRRRTIGSGPIKVIFESAFAGVDWGFGAGHPGALVVGGVTKAGTWYVVDENYAEGLYVAGTDFTSDSWVRRALALKAKWEVEAFFCDAAEPASIRQFRDAKLNALACDKKDRRAGIQTVAKYLHPDPDTLAAHLYFSSTCTKTIEEMVCYHWEDGGKEEPAKVMDHTMDALRYMIYTQDQRARFKRDITLTGSGR